MASEIPRDRLDPEVDEILAVLRYRLGRAEQELGRSLKQPATIAAVHIALIADRP